MKIEFFHDVICSFCFPMSYRMRQLKERHPELEIIQRSFALVPELSAFDVMFGSHENAKKEIMSHWEHANMNDDLHRFNIEGMKEKDFLFPMSMPALRAVKGAEIVGGNDLSWDAFDALQHALFVENKKVDEMDVIVEAIETIDIDMDAWHKAYEDPQSLDAVHEELALARAYGITGVPFVVVNGKYGINGAQPLEQIEAQLARIKEEENQMPLQMVTEEDDGSACALDDDGKWNCD